MDSGAPIIIGGFAGTTANSLDPFAATLVQTGVAKDADLFAFHAYAPSGLWDLPYGLFEGHLLSLGCDTELYCDEQGSSNKNPAQQGFQADRAMGRLFANGITKLTNFNAGGENGDDFGILDGKCQPRPAYLAFADYLPLAQNGGRRLLVSMVSPDGAPLKGVYAAAATHADGSVTLVVNPVDALPPPDLAGASTLPAGPGELLTPDAGKWVAFFGAAAWKGHAATLAPAAGKDYCGFFRKVTVDPAVVKEIEVAAPACAGKWSLVIKAGGKTVDIISGEQTGVIRKEFASRLPSQEPQEIEVSFRIYNSLTLSSVKFPETSAPIAETPVAAAPAAAKPVVSVLIRFPLAKAGAWKATATCGGKPCSATLKLQNAGGQTWGELALTPPGRTVVTIRP